MFGLRVYRHRVSISVEKPIPWRQHALLGKIAIVQCFNLCREANPLATGFGLFGSGVPSGFQSLSRSQSPGDLLRQALLLQQMKVSISVEKPIPWRRKKIHSLSLGISQFQSLSRSQSPGDVL